MSRVSVISVVTRLRHAFLPISIDTMEILVYFSSLPFPTSRGRKQVDIKLPDARHPTPAPIPFSFAIDLSSYTVDLSTTLPTATATTTNSTTVEDPGNHCRRPLPATNTTKFISLFFSLKSRSFSLLLLKVI